MDGEPKNVRENYHYFIKGWINYYKYADILKLLKKVYKCYRRRLRMVIWKQWKKIKTKWRNLIKLGNLPIRARHIGPLQIVRSLLPV